MLHELLSILEASWQLSYYFLYKSIQIRCYGLENRINPQDDWSSQRLFVVFVHLGYQKKKMGNLGFLLVNAVLVSLDIISSLKASCTTMSSICRLSSNVGSVVSFLYTCWSNNYFSAFSIYLSRSIMTIALPLSSFFTINELSCFNSLNALYYTFLTYS